MQDVPYTKQLLAKQEALQHMFLRDVDIVPSPNPYAYRHRMDFVTAFGKIGLRKKGDAKIVVKLDKCHIVDERVSYLLHRMREWMDELGVHDYNYITHRGDMRYLTTRYAPSSGQLMVIVVTGREDTTVTPLLDRLQQHAESVVWAVQPRRGDDSHGDIREIRGRETIEQDILGNTFEIGPNCFFQNNLLLLDDMFREILRHIRGLTLDLYCGVGAIGLSAAEKATRVVAVDIVEENIAFAKRNAARNSVEDVEFILDNANHFLAYYEGDTPDTVVVDPPRDGLAPKLIRKINRLGAPNLVYVSCNPKTYLRDLDLLEGYQLEEMRAFDMFPQTPHVELVTRLARI
ncbi:23S rRNA (uracil(1939)-C(5))-methyltransferase RlmD [bacterium]|nr:23S rRNA (uracil(1939)-C(5))-methyltransferase RlmD [bacterium]